MSTSDQTIRNALGDGGHRHLSLDGWANLLTGLGTARDKRMAGAVRAVEHLPFEVLVDLFRGCDLAARIIEAPPNEMTREWVDVLIDRDRGEEIEQWLEKLHAPARLQTALEWSRAYGGAGVLLGNAELERPGRASQPMRPGEPVEFLTVFASRELQARAYYDNPFREGFGEPALYALVPMAAIGPRSLLGPLPEVHASRILRFDGVVAHRRQLLENYGWGDSILQRCWEVVRDYQISWGAAANLLQDFAQAVLKTPGLRDAIANNEEELVKARAEIFDLNRSVSRIALIDGDEEFLRHVTPLSGVPEVLQQFALRVASAARMPVTKLLGQAPAGLNATGDADIRGWYDEVAAEQRRRLVPAIRRIIDQGCGSSAGPAKAPSNYTIEPRPLWQMTDGEKAEVRSKQATTDVAMIDRGVLSPDEVRRSRYGGDAWTLETTLDTGTRGAFGSTDPTEGDSLCVECGAQALAGSPCPECGAPVTPVSRLEEPSAGPAMQSQEETSPGADLQALALNGAQIAGLLSILESVKSATIPPEAAVLALQISFPAQVDEAKARALVSKIEIKEPQPVPPALVAGAQPGQPPPPSTKPPKPDDKSTPEE